MVIKSFYKGFMALVLGLGMSQAAFGAVPGAPIGEDGNPANQQPQGWRAKLARLYASAANQLPGVGVGMGIGAGLTAAVTIGCSKAAGATVAVAPALAFGPGEFMLTWLAITGVAYMTKSFLWDNLSPKVRNTFAAAGIIGGSAYLSYLYGPQLLSLFLSTRVV